MNVNKIGIKLADGSFFSILTENLPAKKELELTTVRDNQTTVQVNLYKTNTDSMLDADYVDTLLIANLVSHKKGEPTIKLHIALDEENMLSAEAFDAESGGSSNITVSLVKLSDYELSEDVDFDIMSQNGDLTPDVSFDNVPPYDEKAHESGDYSSAINDFDYLNKSVKKDEKKHFSVITCVVCAIISLVALACMLFFYFAVPRLTIKAEVIGSVPAAHIQPAPPPVLAPPAVEAIENKIVVVEQPVVVPAPPAPAPVKPQEVRYKIKWGDTLWDISDAYYKNPWQYKKIAKANNIKNPDFIIAGAWIVIPPK